MDQKLQELTEKLYQEGVLKGNNEAEKIIADARVQAKEIIENAKAEAEAIIIDSEKKSAELSKNTRSELQLASGQMLSALQQEVVTLISGSIIEATVKPATDDIKYIQELILTAVQNWSAKQDLLIAVSEKDIKSIESFFESHVKKQLDKGITINSANNIKAGFQIGPADGSYKVSFTQDDFMNFFKEFIRPKVVELLYGQK
jgi:V/A-type H+-transporting ATPase subunit E